MPCQIWTIATATVQQVINIIELVFFFQPVFVLWLPYGTVPYNMGFNYIYLRGIRPYWNLAAFGGASYLGDSREIRVALFLGGRLGICRP